MIRRTMNASLCSFSSSSSPSSSSASSPSPSPWYRPSAIYCYNTQTKAWTHKAASVVHRGGAMAVAGTTIAIAGGFDPSTNKTTSVVDIFVVDF